MTFQCRLVLAAALVLSFTLRANAQTVIVRSAPPGATVAVTFNGGQPVSEKADGYGDARLAVPTAGRETDVQIHADVCGSTVKVLINEPGQPPPGADAGCTRKDMWGVYIMRPVTTFVVEISGTDASVYVAQGAPPLAWLRRGNQRITRLPWGEPGKGLALSLGTGLSSFGGAGASLCGSTACNTDGVGLALHAGLEFWITKNVAAQVGYVRPSDVTATATSDTFTFETRRVARIATITGKAGGPIGPARLYGIAGVNRHEATETTNETVPNRTVTVNGVTQTIAGGTQAFAQKTAGWSWVLGGGFELWTTKWVGVYAELTRAKLRGSAVGGGEGAIEEQATFILGGARVRLWR